MDILESKIQLPQLRPKSPDSDTSIQKWIEWEGRCQVPPVRFALVNVNKPYDLAHAVQLSLATSVNEIPYVAFEIVGNTMDLSDPKVTSKVTSWNIRQTSIDKVPRRKNSLKNLKEQGFRLIGTVPDSANNALDHEYQNNDVIVIGGANGLSQKDLSQMDEVVTIPSNVPFMTIPTVLPIFAYKLLHDRGLWKNKNRK